MVITKEHLTEILTNYVQDSTHFKNLHKGHPNRPCILDKCIVRASCNYRDVKDCNKINDYFNALFHKDTTCHIVFFINEEGEELGIEKRPVDNCTMDQLIDECYVWDDFNLDRHIEYTKHLGSLPYYDLL